MGGNGIVLDGSTETDKIIKLGLSWDVMGGVARRSWARSKNAINTAKEWNLKMLGKGQITLPYTVSDEVLSDLNL